MMGSVQIASRVDDAQARLFRETTRRLGTTPADAIRMFVSAFNQSGGFPYDVRLPRTMAGFESESEATSYATELAMGLINETR